MLPIQNRRVRCARAASNRRRTSALWASEHAVSVDALLSWDLFLHNVPMFCDLAIGHAENIDRNHRLRSPSDVAAMNHDIIAIRHHETWFVFKVARQVSQQRLDRRSAIRDQRVMLPVVIAEQ